MLPSLSLPKWLLYNVGQFHVWCSSGHGISRHGCAGDSSHVPSGTSVSVWLFTTHTWVLNASIAVQIYQVADFSLPLFFVVCLYVHNLRTYSHSKQLQSKRLLTALAGCPFWANIQCFIQYFSMFHGLKTISSGVSISRRTLNPSDEN